MLGVTKYDQTYIDQCRARSDAQVAAYDNLAEKVRKAKLATALAEFEPTFFTNMVLVLESYFTHRLRTIELKDGNPCNEVRVLAASILSNDGKMMDVSPIKMKPATSVLGYAVGDAISLTEDDYLWLAKAFFADIESKYAG